MAIEISKNEAPMLISNVVANTYNKKFGLMVVADIYGFSFGYIREGDYLNKVFNPASDRTSVESLGGIRLGDVIQSIDDKIDKKYIIYDSLYGCGRIYPIEYDYKNSDKNDFYEIKVLVEEKSNNINFISIGIEGFFLSSGSGLGDSSELIEIEYADNIVEK